VTNPHRGSPPSRSPPRASLLRKSKPSSPVFKMSDNEDATPSLGHSEILSDRNSRGDPIPELDQHPEERPNVRPSSTGGRLGRSPTLAIRALSLPASRANSMVKLPGGHPISGQHSRRRSSGEPRLYTPADGSTGSSSQSTRVDKESQRASRSYFKLSRLHDKSVGKANRPLFAGGDRNRDALG
jgi:hypothetical protein